MHRPVWKLRSITDSFAKSKSKSQHGLGNVADKVGVSRFVSTSTGVCYFRGYRGDLTKTAQMQIVSALRLGERSRASSLLLDLGHGNHALRADDFVDILSYCASSPDPLFVMETWQIMKEKNISLNSLCYMHMMEALCKGGYLDEAFNLINILGESHSICGILPVYNSFLRACAKMRSIIHANQCLHVMEQRMVGKNESTYPELVELAVWQQDLSTVHEIWRDYIKHYSPGILCLQKFIWSFSRLRDLKSAYETLQHMVVLAIRGNHFVERTVEGRFYSSRLDIPIPSSGELSSEKFNLENTELEDYASEVNHCSSLKSAVETVGMGVLSNHMSWPAKSLVRRSFNDVIHACAKTKECGLAEQLMLQMQSLGLQPSINTYDGFVKTVVSEKGTRDGMKLLKLMQQRNLKPYDSTFATLAIGFSRDLELDLAEALLDQISRNRHLHPYNAFLAACDMTDQPERAVPILAKMKRLKVRPDIRTYELLFSLFGNVNAPYEEGNILSQVDSSKRINAIEMHMAKNGIQHSQLSMKNLLKALGTEGMIRELIQYLRVAENLFRHNGTCLGTPIYNVVLHSLVKAEESHRAIEIFKNMKLCGFQPNAATYSIMIECCSVIRCFKSACALVSLMLRDGYYPETLVYTSLIKILLKDGDFDGALNLLDQANLEDIQLDILLYNTILYKAHEEATMHGFGMIIISILAQEKIQPDPSTCHYVFSAYVDAGFHGTAMEALQVLSMRMISEDDHQDMRTKFEEEFILDEGLEAESRIIQLFKDSDEYLAVALLNLRWCAILGFPIHWSPNQSLWVRKLATSYDARTSYAN
ncbi:pentatricopeptide repeat-containing protein At1g76280 isoform X3 [Tripterygium wilfordii]|uniref:pentatricopeptide repeat-containing protein At1g76280 isoform X3 n=1 Tax=Tripterygium wilfordii TaxID=458696 RepID=UPI0018F826E0|nr:pentatricopeptide repeat-containing protein At1g76280 isoform X3 [Tripterygium wilfordii]